MIEIRWHGRGGQGVVTAANILGAAAMHEGKWAQSFPFFGAERRGAPVSAFTRIAGQPVRLRSQIYNPDWVIVFDDTLFDIINPLEGLCPQGGLVVNTRRPAAQLPAAPRVVTVDATGIAQAMLGRPVANTAMLGVLAGIGLVGMEAIERAITEAFPGVAGERNRAAARQAFAAVAGQEVLRETSSRR